MLIGIHCNFVTIIQYITIGPAFLPPGRGNHKVVPSHASKATKSVTIEKSLFKTFLSIFYRVLASYMVGLWKIHVPVAR